MLYLNSAVNPVLYNLMSSKFRDGFLLVCRLRKKHQLKSYRSRDRCGTFRTTSSYTTSSSLSRRSNSLKHSIFKKASLTSNEDVDQNNKGNSRPKLDRSISSLPNLFPIKTDTDEQIVPNNWKKYADEKTEDVLKCEINHSKERVPFLMKQKSLDFVLHNSGSLRKSVLLRSASKTIDLEDSALRMNSEESFV
jgi:hypothetical protein